MIDNLDDLNKKKDVNARAAFYKKPIKKDNYRLEIDEDTPQEIRRQELLQRQKKKRDDIFNNSRGIVEEVFSNYDDDADDEEEEMEIDKSQTKSTNKQKYRKNNIMLSEWMLEVPKDFVDKWIMVPCPVGRRTLLAASKGITKAYNKQGRQVARFHSELPGGNKKDFYNKYTILDCIWQPEEKVYYVLDVLAWSNQVLMNCDTTFRFFWLNSKLNETTEYQEQNAQNAYAIRSLPNITCDGNLSEFLTNLSNFSILDGLLFYHRDGHYTRGRTPLVTWLKPYMLTEMLGISIPESYEEKPASYIDAKHFFASKGWRKRRSNFDSSMEFDSIDT